jgi:hypothetical protein
MRIVSPEQTVITKSVRLRHPCQRVQRRVRDRELRRGHCLGNDTVLVKKTAYPIMNRLEPEQIQLQLYSGIQYVLWMSDATGVGTGGSTNVSGYAR